MGIKVVGIQKTTESFSKAKEELDRQTADALMRSGERLISIALSTRTYKDDTGRLSHSYGYAVYRKGRAYGYGGASSCRQHLDEMARSYKDLSMCLVMIADTEYAVYLEHIGFVVLDGAYVNAQSVIKEEFGKIKLSI